MPAQALAAQFLRLHDAFLGIEASHPKMNEQDSRRRQAEAAQAAKRAIEAGVLSLPSVGFPQPRANAFEDDTGLWVLSWRSLCLMLRVQYPEAVRPDVGRLETGTDANGHIVQSFEDVHWRERARDYAGVCLLLADLVGKPTPPSHSFLSSGAYFANLYAKGMKDAKIRDHWQAMSDDERKAFCPADWGPLATDKKTSDGKASKGALADIVKRRRLQASKPTNADCVAS